MFTFFHLGSDAKIEIDEQGERLKVSVSHRRVASFEVSFDHQEVQRMADNPDFFEDVMLDYLVRHRQS